MKKRDLKKMVLLLALENALLIRAYIDREVQIRENANNYKNDTINELINNSSESSTNSKKDTTYSMITYACGYGYQLKDTKCYKMDSQQDIVDNTQEEVEQLTRK